MKILSLAKQKIIDNPFFASSLVMIIGTNVYNAGQFGYHIVAGRILGKAYYGDVAALLNILGVFALVQISLGLTIVKFVASEKDPNKVRGLIWWAMKWSGIFGLLVAILIIIFAPFINNFLQISQPLAVYFLAPIVALYAIVSIIRSSLQGLLRFGWFVITMLVEIFSKLILIIPLALAGYAVVGAMTALLVGVLASLVIGIYSLNKFLLKDDGSKPDISPLIKYSIPAFLQGIALTSMYSTDLFLVKHFFHPETAGLYAALAKLGSIVFFGASPIAHVMFPLVAKRKSHGEPYHKIFYLSLLLIGGMAGLIVLTYFLVPELFLSALGSNFIDGSPMLWWFGLFMGLLVIGVLFVQFYLSIGKTFVVWLFIFTAGLQAMLIWFFHDTILTVIQMSILSAALLVISLLLYFPYHDRK